MSVSRIIMALSGAALLFAAAPASAQFFIKPADLTGPRVTGTEPGITGPELPGATPDELRAALVWNLRAALNVAALQCQFEPTLLTLHNYNGLLNDHQVELRKAYLVLEGYFVRMNKKVKKVGQTELDRFGTRVYSGFSTVSGQLSFCQTAADIAHVAIFTRPGGLTDLAQSRMRELRESLRGWGEQAFPRNYSYRMALGRTPPFGNIECWKDNRYVAKKCGVLPEGWGVMTTTASR